MIVYLWGRDSLVGGETFNRTEEEWMEDALSAFRKKYSDIKKEEIKIVGKRSK